MDLVRESSHLTGLLIGITMRATILLALVGGLGWILTRNRPTWRGLAWACCLLGLVIVPFSALLMPSIALPLPLLYDAAELSERPSMPSRGMVDPSSLGSASATPEIGQHLPVWDALIAGIYITGLIVALLRVGLGLLKTRQLRGQTHTLLDSQLADQWRRRLGINQKVEVGISNAVMTPTVIGVLHPLIIIPGQLYASYEEEDLDSIVVHELAHVKRWDLAVNWVGILAVSLYWFHPLVHLLQWGLRKVREEACDDWVLDTLGNEKMAYAKTLVDATYATRMSLAAQLRMDMARASSIPKRIERIERTNIMDPRLNWLASPVAVTIVGSAVLLGCLAGAVPANEKVQLFPIYTDSGVGFIDGSGEIKIEPKFSVGFHEFSEGLCAVEEGGKWGFINETGAFAIQPTFEKTAYHFMGGRCGVFIDGKWGFIDRSGVVVVEPRYDEVGFFSEGLASVRTDGLWGFVDQSGNMVIEPQYKKPVQSPPSFRNGLVEMRQQDGHSRYINTEGVLVWSGTVSSEIQPYYFEALERFEVDVSWAEFFVVSVTIGLTGRDKTGYVSAGEIESSTTVQQRLRQSVPEIRTIIVSILKSKNAEEMDSSMPEVAQEIENRLQNEIFSTVFSMEEDGLEVAVQTVLFPAIIVQ